VAGSVTKQSESVTKRSHGYDVWFAEERTWTAGLTCPAPAELYPGEKGPFRIFDCLQKNLVFCRKMWYFSRKIRIYYQDQVDPRLQHYVIIGDIYFTHLCDWKRIAFL
jgi:hypothetical protein